MTHLRAIIAGSRLSFRLIQRSGTRHALSAAILSVAAAILLGVELLLVREVVEALQLDSSATLGIVFFGVATSLRRVINSALNEVRWRTVERIQMSVNTEVVERATSVSFERFEDPQFQDVVARALAGSEHAWTAVWGLLGGLNALFGIATLGLVLVGIAPDLLPAFALAAILLLVVAAFRSRIGHGVDWTDTQPERERRYLERALTSRSEGKEIRLFGSQSLLLGRHRGLFEQRIVTIDSASRRRFAQELVGNVGLAVVLVGTLLAVADRAGSGQLTLAAAAAAAIGAQQLAGQLQALAIAVGSVGEAALYVADIEQLTNETIAEPHPPSDLTVLRFDRVSFRYPDTAFDALNDLSFELKLGEVVALVGPNGSGKSTVVKLLTGLYSPTAGEIFLESSEGLLESVRGELRGTVAAVFQDYARYELSVAENIRLGHPDQGLTDEQVFDAVRDVGLEDAVNKLDDGIDSRLGRQFDDSVDFSIGEWQRLAIARAMVSTAPFVVLDEPASALDSIGEADVFRRSSELFGRRGVLLLSHRFATVRTADRVLVIDEGKIVERGTHDELVALGGVYAAMYKLQADRTTGEGV
ncbi:MAG: ABC transporter ATP-binding protein [Acidimicrobiales bacterium]